MAPPYPVLNNKPIDQWKVTELKEELKRRKLPVRGLKEELVNRLDEALRMDMASEGEHGSDDGFPDETPTEEADDSVPDEIRSEEADAVTSNEIDPAVEGKTEKAIPNEMAAIKEEDDFAPYSDAQVTADKNEPQPHAEDHPGLAVNEALEVGDTVKSVKAVDMALDSDKVNTPYDRDTDIVVNSINVPSDDAEDNKLQGMDTVPASLSDVGEDKLQDMDMAPAPLSLDVAEDTKLQGMDTSAMLSDVSEDKLQDMDMAPAALSSDVVEDSKLEGIDTAPAMLSNVNVDKLQDMEMAPAALSDAVVMESMMDKDTIQDNVTLQTPVHDDLPEHVSRCDEEQNEPTLSDKESKPRLSELNNQVSEVSPVVGSPIKCESISTDSMSINEKNKLKDNLNADNFDLELEVKPEMVRPSPGIPPLGGDLLTFGDGKDLFKDQVTLEEIEYKVNDNIHPAKIEDSIDGGSPEKLNLDRSSGDESMEEDVTESKHVESNAKPDELGERAEIVGGHAVKEETLPDAVDGASSADNKVIIAEEKIQPVASIEKRKLEGQGTATNNEIFKRQRRWNTENVVKVPERQTSNLNSFNAPKDVFQPTPKRSFTRPDTVPSGDTPQERTVPPAQKPATTSLRIDRFVRPFTLKAVQELLAKTGTVGSFWMDHIKTHCYVTYSSVEEAVATRDAVYNLQWPPNGGNHLIVEFVDPQEVKSRADAPLQSPVSISPHPMTSKTSPPFQRAPPSQNLPRQTTPREQQQQLPPPPPLSKPPTPNPTAVRERLPPPPPKKPEPPVMTLDDLFKKTKTSPRIYYLPLSEEQVAAKSAAQVKGRGE